MHHRLNSCSDRLKPSQPQQVQRRGAQRGHGSGAIAAVSVGVLMELGVADPVPALNAPSVTHQLQQCFWRGAQTGDEQMGGVKGFTVAPAVAVTSTIQLVPIQASRMCSGACLARRVQVMLRPWPIS